ncbi:MAG: FIG00816111: hypothetical protein [uncultured Friedmanniella sp.]|uniref:Uncharacterized protein n=1 Tax=uncultured Friedmanniella sp. TaxID=335381 RepID=A0A6J4LHG7_9ACTN|nr:MAG: FIG00816111: hypothetical protein [uncultured Friedmanniella sp.]
MPVVESQVTVPLEPELAFWVSQTTAPIRYRWDPFVRSQHLLDGADRPARGVRTATTSRHGLSMVSSYVSFSPPSNVGMTMVGGPWFFARFGGGWRFVPGDEAGTTRVAWRYNFATRPRLLEPLADRIGRWLLQRDIDRRIAGYARGCLDPVVLAAAHEAAAAG